MPCTICKENHTIRTCESPIITIFGDSIKRHFNNIANEYANKHDPEHLDSRIIQIQTKLLFSPIQHLKTLCLYKNIPYQGTRQQLFQHVFQSFYKDLLQDIDTINNLKITITHTTTIQECPICFENKDSSTTNCGHSFCIDCVQKINRCAICRSPITEILI